MKSLQELYKEITAGDEQKAAFAEAAKSGKARTMDDRDPCLIKSKT